MALSFFSGVAREAYRLADQYRARGVTAVAGGTHVSHWTEEALAHVDTVVTAEAETAWPELIRDQERGTLRRLYRGQPSDPPADDGQRILHPRREEAPLRLALGA